MCVCVCVEVYVYVHILFWEMNQPLMAATGSLKDCKSRGAENEPAMMNVFKYGKKTWRYFKLEVIEQPEASLAAM